jgi:acylaminoacyl-peptidase
MEAKPDAPLPTVFVIHGGPWTRDKYGYRGDHPWLASRGYAVVSVNYRGSAGFGKAFLNAGDRQHAAKIHDDILDAVDWAIAEGIARPDRIAIFGGSYGGYEALVGLTFTPDVFRCAASLFGMSSLTTLLQSFPAQMTGVLEQMYRRFGDPRTEAGRSWLAAHSPLSRVDQIRRPLLIGHGAHDIRCRQAESDQLVAAMRERGLPVIYLFYPDEGHGFQRPENRLSFHAILEAFLAEHLGGEAEPLADDLVGSGLEIRAGEDLVRPWRAVED